MPGDIVSKMTKSLSGSASNRIHSVATNIYTYPNSLVPARCSCRSSIRRNLKATDAVRVTIKGGNITDLKDDDPHSIDFSGVVGGEVDYNWN